MKKNKSQIFLGVVCAILGFLLVYEYKVALYKRGVRYNTTNILSDIEILKQDKEDLGDTNTELSKKLKEIEESAAEETAQGNEIKEQLYDARMNLGLVDVVGNGIRIKIKLKSTMFNSSSKDSSKLLEDTDLVKFLGTLWFGGAEAISVNDMRITPQTGVNILGKDILVGSAGKINLGEEIIIEAIGDVEKIKKNLNEEYGTNSNSGFGNYNVNIEDVKELKIEKTTESIESEHLNKVNNG